MSLLSARGISKAYGPQTLFDDVSLTIEKGDRVGGLGVNGSGESRLLRVVAGLGNIYVDEALWRAQLHPLRPARTLDRTQ